MCFYFNFPRNTIRTKKLYCIYQMIIILGYFDRHNLGDDAFAYVWNEYMKRNFPDTEYIICNIDDIKTIPSKTSLVLFGGGDVINNYFIPKLLKLTEGTNIPYYAVSIGIPYPKLIDEGYLDNFDYIIHRSKVDNAKLLKKYSPSRVKWYPDLSYLMLKYNNNKDSTYIKSHHAESKRIGVFLARNIFNSQNVHEYHEIVNQVAATIVALAQMRKFNGNSMSCVSLLSRKNKECEFEIYLIPFCTDTNPTHDDRLVNKDVYDKVMSFGHFDNVHLIDKALPVEEIVPVFKSFFATLCMRFHAHVFSLMTETPMLSLYYTSKVHNLLSEAHLEDYACKMDVDQRDFPFHVDHTQILAKFHLLFNKYQDYKKQLQSTNKYYRKRSSEMETCLNNLLYHKVKHYTFSKLRMLAHKNATLIATRILSFYGICLNKHRNLIENIVSDRGGIGKFVESYSTIFAPNSRDLKCTCCNYIGCGDAGDVIDEALNHMHNVKRNIVEIISYTLTCNRRSSYNYGLAEQIFGKEYKLIDSCEWILNHLKTSEDNVSPLLNNKLAFKLRKLNTTYINKNLLKGYHRSGWEYVTQNLDKLHNPDGVIFDNYLDKTFGWDCEFLTQIKVLPYKTEWIGVFHHTPNEQYSINNLVNCFNQKVFIKSLIQCKGLIVFSTYLKDWIHNQLTAMNFNVPIIMLYHPSEKVSEFLQFDYNEFLLNKEKKVIQIGAWLRNSYAIYELPDTKGYQKCVLKWKGMENYFVDWTDLEKLKCYAYNLGHKGQQNCSGVVVNCDGTIICGNPVEDKNTNKYIVGLFQMIRENHESVKVLDMVPNEEYDHLLKKNIVFIELVDASAVNTVIECIVRNTPILVNKLPAVVEYLGESYPLFYKDIQHAHELLSNKKKILQAYKYLRKLDKSKFTIEHFIHQLTSNPVYKNLHEIPVVRAQENVKVI
jgi:hypothetical protein